MPKHVVCSICESIWSNDWCFSPRKQFSLIDKLAHILFVHLLSIVRKQHKVTLLSEDGLWLLILHRSLLLPFQPIKTFYPQSFPLNQKKSRSGKKEHQFERKVSFADFLLPIWISAPVINWRIGMIRVRKVFLTHQISILVPICGQRKLVNILEGGSFGYGFQTKLFLLVCRLHQNFLLIGIEQLFALPKFSKF